MSPPDPVSPSSAERTAPTGASPAGSADSSRGSAGPDRPSAAPPVVIGICGRALAGKSTCAQAMVGHCGGRVVAMADSLRDVVEAAFGSRYETQEAKLATDPFWAPRLGERWSTGRQILQRVGSELFRELVHPDFWLFHLELRLSRLATQPLIVIPDVRFDNEAQWVRAHGGWMLHLLRADQPPSADAHQSERGVSPAHVDQVVTSSSVAMTEAFGRDLAVARLRR